MRELGEVEAFVYSDPRLGFKGAEPVVLAFVRERFARQLACAVHELPDRERALAALSSCAQRTDWVVLQSAMNPLIDVALVREMIAFLTRIGADACVSAGAIPGTAPDCVVRGSRARGCGADGSRLLVDARVLEWGTQRRFNNQFNLMKFKRLKMFLGVRDRVPGLPDLTIEALCSRLADDDLHDELITYFEPGEIVRRTECPHCRGMLHGLQNQMSQPLIGYVSTQRPWYFRCERCGLIVASPTLDGAHLGALYDEFDAEDHRRSHTNPNQFACGRARCELGMIAATLPRDAAVLDLGGGAGGFSAFLRGRYPEWRITHSDLRLRASDDLTARGVAVRLLDFVGEPIGESAYDLITAWEVLEHVAFEDLDRTLANIGRALRPGGVFMFSTPDFDSPLCKVVDFFSVAVPFHTVVFSRSWLEGFLCTRGWRVVDVRWTADLLDDADMWFGYAAVTSPGDVLRSTAAVLRAAFTGEAGAAAHRQVVERGFGTEVIMAVTRER